MISDARGSHVSPGIYTEERDVAYSVKSLGITSLGLVGETLYGPAFQDIEIENWGEYVDYFGGTSTEKFKGTGLPKYELPYIAKSYLEESKRLHVVRVLGLSGYYAGPCWVIKDGDAPVVILRSKMSYNTSDDDCGIPQVSKPEPIVKNITTTAYTEIAYDAKCSGAAQTPTKESNPNHFAIKVECEGGNYYTYNLSLNPSDSTYIYNVLSSRPDTGTTPVYIESVFEGSFSGGTLTIAKGDDSGVTEDIYFTFEKQEAVSADESSNIIYELTEVDYDGNKMNSGNTLDIKKTFSAKTGNTYVATEEIESGYTYIKATLSVKEVLSDYLEGYRAAQTPWIVSDAVVTTSESTVRKLFKFVTISDGDAANYQIKVSIQNIKPEEGTFDVIVRDFNDSDASPIILEKFIKCNLVEGDAGYIAYKIGTADGGFISKSKYILVEMTDGEDLRNCVPAGFLGYPVPKYGTTKGVSVSYNTEYNPNMSAKKQYFGMSNLTKKMKKMLVLSEIFSHIRVFTHIVNGTLTQIN